jgi:xanthine dehydrogenase accessory factor
MSEPDTIHSAAIQHDTLSAARAWLARDGHVALATVIDTWGSAPVPVGGQMAVAADGRFQGSVSGGCIEGEVITAAADVIDGGAPRVLAFGVDDETAWSVGLPCGGKVRVLVERLDAANAGLALLDKAVAARGARTGLVVRTRLTDGRRDVFERGQPGVSNDIAARFKTGKSALQTTTDGELFVHALVPPARIIIIGATHIAQIVTEIARLSGYEAMVIDPRTAFASADRFRGVALYAEWPQDALPRIGLDPYTALVVLAHVAHIDDEALKVALRADCLYIGALGSARNHAKRTERLTQAGFTAEEIARIKCPIGIDIGAQTPAEIAVSVMAEVIGAVRGPKPKRVASNGV